MKALIATAALLALGACANSPKPTTTADAAKPTQVAKKSVEGCIPDTGTRLQRCADERMMHRIGSAEAQEDGYRVQSISNITGGRSN